jgi:predicted transposase YbfD/YdcC
MLSLMVAGFACGRVVLRRVEDFCSDLGPHARRRLGVPKAVSDSTLYRLLSQQDPSGFRETVWKQLQRLLDAKLVNRDLFRHGVVSFDGKTVWSSTSRTVEGAKQSADERTGLVTSSLGTLRAVLTSALGQPCLDLELIAAKTGESPAFREVFRRIAEQFGRHFEIVTADSGMTGRENALLIRGADKHYVLGLKGNQPTLHGFAERWFEAFPGACLKETVEWEHGGRMTRQLHSVNVADLEGFDFYGASEVWRVTQTWTHPDGNRTEEARYFISSMPPKMLTPTEKLALVRLHWGIENGHHWALDVALEEDDRQPVQTTREAIEVVAWLRVLAYNLLAIWRARAPLKDGRRISWTRSMELLRDALVHARMNETELLAPLV